MSTRTATIRCPGCGQEIMRGAALECTFKPSVQASTYRTFDSPQERDWLCMECKYIVENHYGDLSSVTSEDAYTLLYSVRIKKGSSCSCCSSCIITQLNNLFYGIKNQGRIQGEGAGGAHPPPEMTCGFLIQLVFCEEKKKTMWFNLLVLKQSKRRVHPLLKKMLKNVLLK